MLFRSEAFFEKVAPYIKTWTMPVSFRKLLEEHPKPTFLYRPIEDLSDESREQAPARQTLTTEPVYELPDTSERARRRVKARLSDRAIQGLLIAAGVLVFGNWGENAYQNFSEHRQEEGLALQGVRFRAPRPREISLETPRGEPRAIRFGDGSFVTLGPRTEFGFETGLWLTGLHGRLEGEATIEVSKADGDLFLETPAGKVLLYTGMYAVRCEVDCTEMLITVGAGLAHVQGNSPKTRLMLTAGQFGRVPADGTPERATGGEGYPKIATFGKAAP